MSGLGFRRVHRAVTPVTAAPMAGPYKVPTPHPRGPFSLTELVIMYRSIVPAAVLVALLASTAAHAQEDVMRVRIGDLNLQQEYGAKVALRRIKSASDAFCGGHKISAMEFHRQITKCRQTMTDKAVAQLDAPLVTAIYEPKGERKAATELARR